MSRHTLKVAAVWIVAAAAELAANDPHLDPRLVPGGCKACHQGHGVSRSPMLAAPQRDVCLACHESEARAEQQIRRGHLAQAARPPFLGSELAKPYLHPISNDAFSRFDHEAVTCSSCHSPHRRSTSTREAAVPGTAKPSTRNPAKLERDLCLECHGPIGPSPVSADDLARKISPRSRSWHPIQTSSGSRSPTVARELSGGLINCTDCHFQGDPGAPRGPHASSVKGLLGRSFVTTDGSAESASAYGLCYECHDRKRLFDGSDFPLHRLHVVDERTSCATCHDPHGSVRNRALVPFGEETVVPGVNASLGSGRLEFLSDQSGSGACYLSCHGVDHDPKGYGLDALRLQPQRESRTGEAPGSDEN